jgi:hypothetical protein
VSGLHSGHNRDRISLSVLFAIDGAGAARCLHHGTLIDTTDIYRLVANLGQESRHGVLRFGVVSAYPLNDAFIGRSLYNSCLEGGRERIERFGIPRTDEAVGVVASGCLAMKIDEPDASLHQSVTKEPTTQLRQQRRVHR